jgi:ATP-dependent 26S proteasome regulatory subunit
MITKDDIGLSEADRQSAREVGQAGKELEEMIGLSSVKEVIHKAIANFKFKKVCADKGIRKEQPSLHMVFTGNPGTAKTTVARLLAEIMRDEKLLPSGNFVEVGRADIVDPVVGATARLVRKKFKEAQGGILFIDEAYALCDACSISDEAINTLVQEMENHREDVIVIFAGYPEPMKQFLEKNLGMSSRIAFHVNFEDYSVIELSNITRLMLSKRQMTITDDAMDKLNHIYENVVGTEDFGNGRFVRKMIEEAEMNLAQRIEKYDVEEITTEMITVLEACDIPELDARATKQNHIGFCA